MLVPWPQLAVFSFVDMPMTQVEIDSANKLVQSWGELTTVALFAAVVVMGLVAFIIQKRSEDKQAVREADKDRRDAEREAKVMQIIAEPLTTLKSENLDMRKLFEGLTTAIESSNKIMAAVVINQEAHGVRLQRVEDVTLDTQERGTKPIQQMKKSIDDLLAAVVQIQTDTQNAFDSADTKLDTIITALSGIRCDLQLAETSIKAAIDDACKEKEKRATDSKPLPVITLADEPEKAA